MRQQQKRENNNVFKENEVEKEYNTQKMRVVVLLIFEVIIG
jgi:hypothetical protein